MPRAASPLRNLNEGKVLPGPTQCLKIVHIAGAWPTESVNASTPPSDVSGMWATPSMTRRDGAPKPVDPLDSMSCTNTSDPRATAANDRSERPLLFTPCLFVGSGDPPDPTLWNKERSVESDLWVPASVCGRKGIPRVL